MTRHEMLITRWRLRFNPDIGGQRNLRDRRRRLRAILTPQVDLCGIVEARYFLYSEQCLT